MCSHPVALVLQQRLDVEASSLRCFEGRDGGGEAGVGRRADRRVLAPDQLHGLRRPRHQLAVEHEPVRAELAPQAGGVGRVADAAECRLGVLAAVEERPPGPGVDRAGLAAVDAEALASATPASRQTMTIAREPMCFSSQITCGTPSERYSANALSGCSSRSGRVEVAVGRHRRRQVDQPSRVDREAAHHLERRGRVLLADRDGAGQARLDDALARDVVDVEQKRRAVLFARRRAHPRSARNGLAGS